MPEQEHEVVMFEVDYLCDECKKPMKASSVVALSNETRHEHVCPDGHYQVLEHHYPRLIRRRYE